MSDKLDSEFFVSRRGRRVGVHEVDMNGIDIEEIVEKKPLQQTKKEPRIKQVRHKKGVSRRIIIASTLVVLLLGALYVITGEVIAAGYRNGVSDAKKQLTSAVSSTVLPAQKGSTVSADKIHDIASKVNSILSHMCTGGMTDNMAGLYPRANQALHSCQGAQANYSALFHSLSDLEAQARYLEKLDGIMKPISTPITDEYAVIGSQQDAWQAAVDGLKKLSPPSEMQAAHKTLYQHVTAVSEAWSKLNTANNNQDVDGFTTSEKALSTEYDAIRATSPLFTRVLDTTQTGLSAAYSALK